MVEHGSIRLNRRRLVAIRRWRPPVRPEQTYTLTTQEADQMLERGVGFYPAAFEAWRESVQAYVQEKGARAEYLQEVVPRDRSVVITWRERRGP